MRSIAIRIAACAALAAAFSRPVAAQDLGAVESLFEEVSAVTVFVQSGGVLGSDNVRGGNLNGAGTEVLINLSAGDAWDLELGLGASFMRGYEAADTTLDLRTSLRAFPTLTLYATPVEIGAASIYTGVSFGLVELWNAQAYDRAGQPWDVEARTFEFGASAGFYLLPVPGVGLFAEGGYRRREFGSLKWAVPDGESLPEAWRSLDFSGYYVQTGVQLRLEEDDEDDDDGITPPAPAGTWTLQRIDGAELPGTITLTGPATAQVVHAVLRLDPATDGTGTYTIDFHMRSPASTQSAPDAVRETGAYHKPGTGPREHVLAFEPEGSGRARTAERLAGRLYVNWNGHVLVFAPGNAKPEE